MRTPPANARMTPARPIAPRTANVALSSKPLPGRDDTQDAQIAALLDRVAALEQAVHQLTSFISVNSLNELMINAPGNIFIQSNGKVQVGAASTVTVTTSKFDIAAAMTEASGVVKAPTIIADSVVGKSYTPGAGNIW